MSTIGTGKDYTTLQAWEDAIPGALTTSYTGECYNEEFTAGVVIAGHTGGSATNFIKLTAAAGESFQDHANVRTTALLYNTQGARIASNDFAVAVVRVQNDYVYVERLQIKRTGASYGHAAVNFDNAYTHSYIKDCVIAKTYSSTDSILNIYDSKAINCLVYDTGATASNSAVYGTSGDGLLQNCTVVRAGSTGGTGVSSGYTNFKVDACAVFGWTTAFFGTFGTSTGYNCTDAASAPGSNNQVSKTYASQFESTTTDFRLKAGADCIDTGNTDATYPNDISATARGVTTAGDSGCWEYAAGGATTRGNPFNMGNAFNGGRTFAGVIR